MLERVAATAVAAPGSEALTSAAAGRRYLGDAVTATFDGDEATRIALLARLLALADAAWRCNDPGHELTPPTDRLASRLQRWEHARHSGAAAPRPHPQEIGARVALLDSAYPPAALLGLDVVATAIAEPVAVHVLAGPISLEEGIRCSAELDPIVAAAATLLAAPQREHDRAPEHEAWRPDRPPRDGREPPDRATRRDWAQRHPRDTPDRSARGAQPSGDPDRDVYVRPGATLAHVERVAAQLELIDRGGVALSDALWARALWLELAAAFVFVHDAYDGRPAHGARWRAVHRIAAEQLAVGRFEATPAAYDCAAALMFARTAALTFAACWLDETRHDVAFPPSSLAVERIDEAAARALLAAWALTPRRAPRTRSGP
ncbi:hypothetical protein [Conexibacter sp. CPCC 206217]|uniref:hypothetical protein n=1 Tax=Conexibacter sp. CPCC 206217 TaxID=3064574 RepID=UPI002725AFF1|nr:hypothetical protein [Conexibacter sp. CPCC 206217]MDO8212549.1 hypothetical protein [Conexibacter sp. CPCC 206217]